MELNKALLITQLERKRDAIRVKLAALTKQKPKTAGTLVAAKRALVAVMNARHKKRVKRITDIKSAASLRNYCYNEGEVIPQAIRNEPVDKTYQLKQDFKDINVALALLPLVAGDTVKQDGNGNYLRLLNREF